MCTPFACEYLRRITTKYLPAAFHLEDYAFLQCRHAFASPMSRRYVALNNIFGSSSEINPASYDEFVAQVISMMCGATVWAYVIGSACGIIATIDPAMIEHRQTMDELNIFVKDQGMPLDLTVKLRSYFRNTLPLVRARRYEHLLLEMSTQLRGDASFNMAKRQLNAVPYLRDGAVEGEFLSHLAVRFSLAVYSRLEHIPCINLFIIDRGVVAKNGNLGLARACFGKDVIVHNDTLRDLNDAIALTFVQTIQLTRADIMDLMPDFPLACQAITRYAFRLALMRAIIKAAAAYRRGDLDEDVMTLSPAVDSVLAADTATSLAKMKAIKLPTLPWDQHKSLYPAPSELVGLDMFLRKSNSMDGPADSISNSPSRPRIGNHRAIPSGAALISSTNATEAATEATAALPSELRSLKDMVGELVQDMRGQMTKMEHKMDQLSVRMDGLAAAPRPLQKRQAKSAANMQPRSADAMPKSSTTSMAAANGKSGDERKELLEERSATGCSPSLSTPFEA